MDPLSRYAALLRSLPDKPVTHPKQPVLVSLSEHLGAPTGLSVDANNLVAWAINQNLLSATAQWKLRETFSAWEQNKPTRSQVATFIEWLACEVKPVARPEPR